MEIMGLEEIEEYNTGVDELETENINLIFVGIDQSWSMEQYVSPMKNALDEFKTSLEDSKDSDEILIARANFSDSIQIGGYKKIQEFENNYESMGMTALYDVVVDGAEKLTEYMDYLKQQGMRVKAVFAIFSDGEDTSSGNSLPEARKKVEELNSKEITTAFISFGSGAVRSAKDMKFKNLLTVGASSNELRKAFNVLSKSVVESSKSATGNTDDFFQM